MMSGTSASIAALRGGYEVAFQANTTRLKPSLALEGGMRRNIGWPAVTA